MLNYSISRHTEYVRQYIYTYMKNLQFDLLVWGLVTLAPFNDTPIRTYEC